MKLVVCILVLISADFQVLAQNFEWLRTFGSSDEAGYDITSEKKGGCSFLISSSHDSIKFDSILFVDHGLSPKVLRNYIVTLDSNGKVTKAIQIGKFFLPNGLATAGIWDLCCDANGNYYLIGYLGDSINIVNSDTMESSKGRIFFIKLDKNFKLIWKIQTGNSTSLALPTNSGVYQDKPITKLTLYGDKLYFLCVTKGKTTIGSNTFFLNSGLTNIIGEIDQSTGSVKWSSYVYSPSDKNMFRVSGLTRLDASLFLSGDFGFTSSEKSAVIGSDTLLGQGGFILETDTFGNYRQSFKIYNANYLQINFVETDGTYLYFGGYFKDSLKWGSISIAPEFPSGVNNSTINYELFAASISSSFKPRWFYRPKIINTTAAFNGGVLRCATAGNGFVYFSGNISAESNFGGHIIKPKIISGDILLFKMDPIGNLLWATHGGGVGFSKGVGYEIDAIAGKSVFATGYFQGQLQFGQLIDSAKGSANPANAFLTKITDYDITRGPVKSGPYCAGDTILVPYTHVGTFDSSNWFIAELSDEYGNFEGGQRELGRIKTNLDSVVPGVLPLFSVASSGAYRIRVRSTAPAIQSYYILDSLRLLIYSRDKADPGPPDTICYRDTFMLNTFGGTRWTWSPDYLMDDSTLRTPRVWPDRDTSYRIIIADSSGCGMADTAFKYIVVKPKPRLTGDTLLYKCPGDFLKIKLNTLFADSGHLIKWYRNNRYFFTGDSMLFAEDADVKLMAVLFDFCSPATDTFFVQVVLNTQAKLMPTADTAVCYGSAVAPAASASGGYKHVFRWFSHSDSFLGFNPVLKVWQPDSFKVVLGDACSDHADSAWMKVTLNNRIYPGAKLLPNDTFFCSNFSLSLLPLLWNNADSVRWFNPASNFTLSLAGQFTLIRPDTLAVSVTNLCGISYDTLVVNQYRNPVLTVDSLYQPCNGSVLQLTAGEPQPATSYRWFNADTSRSVSIAQSGSYSVVAKNNCGTDSASFNVQYISKPTAAFGNADVCEGQWFVFNNLSNGANSFFWRLGDGTVSSDSAPLHQYPTTGQARTFLVSLKAFASADCADSITLPVNVKVTPKPDFIWHAQGKALFFTPLVAGNAYKWFFGDGDSSALDKPVHSYTADSGSYTVCLHLTNAEKCTGITCKNIQFNVGVKELNASFMLYPNPADNAVTISLNKPVNNAFISITTILGNCLITTPVEGSETTIDISGLKPGMYWLELVSENLAGNRIIIKK